MTSNSRKNNLRAFAFLIFSACAVESFSQTASEKKPLQELVVADFEKWPNNLGGQMWVNGGGEPNWGSALHSWIYGPKTPGYSKEKVHGGNYSFCLVNALDPRKLPWANFSIDLGPTTDITLEPKKISSLDATPYAQFCFWVRGEKGGEKLEISFRDAAQREVTLLPLPDGVSAKWQQVRIPLSAIANEVNLSQLDAVNLHFGSSAGNKQGAVLYVDDAAFTGKERAEGKETAPVLKRVVNHPLCVADFETDATPLGGEIAPYGGASANYNDRAQLHSVLYNPQLSGYRVENVFRGKGAYRLVNEMPLPRKELWASLGINLNAGAKPVDVSAYRYLIFWARGEHGGERIKVLFRDAHTPDYVPQIFVDPYPQILKTRWQKIVVPLENISYAVDLTHLVHIGVEFGSWLGNLKGDILYVDDFVFSNLLAESQ